MIPKQDCKIQTYESALITLKPENSKREQFIYLIIASNIALFLIYLFFTSFSTFFVLLLILNGAYYLYELNSYYKIVSFNLKKGIYNISVSGIYTSLNYNATATNVTLRFKGGKSCEKRSLKIHNMYSYGYPFNASMIVEIDEQNECVLEIKKNTIFSDGQLSNTIIVAQPTTYFQDNKDQQHYL